MLLATVVAVGSRVQNSALDGWNID